MPEYCVGSRVHANPESTEGMNLISAMRNHSKPENTQLVVGSVQGDHFMVIIPGNGSMKVKAEALTPAE